MCLVVMSDQTFFVWKFLEALIDRALCLHASISSSHSFLLFLELFESCLLLSLLSHAIDNDQAFSFQQRVLQEVKLLSGRLLGQMIVIALLELRELVLGHLELETGVILFVELLIEIVVL